MSTASEETAVCLDQFITVADRFHRSVNLPKDWADGVGVDTYLLTPTAGSLCGRILSELLTEDGTRAWSVVGPYGAGKSSFALFVTHVLSGGEPSLTPEAEAMRERAGFRRRPFVPVLVAADRSPLENRVAAAIESAFTDIDPTVAEKARTLAQEAATGGEELQDLIDSAATAALAHDLGGVLIVVDEFGKYLEYVAVKPHERDLLFLQTLAEGCARSKSPIVLITILHQGFVDYLPNRAEVHRQEWQKVQGRFREVPFQLPVEQLLGLMSSAITRDVPVPIETAWQSIVDQVRSNPALERARSKIPLDEVLPHVLPLHPIAALLLWPIFRSKMAQNERSLFAFLTSREPFAFSEYLEETEWDGRQVPALFGIARLYDYVDNSLALGVFRGEQGRRWAEIRRCLDRLPEHAGPVAEQLVKAIGLLSMYGPQVGLAASEEFLRVALAADGEEVSTALRLLQDHSIVVYRRHRNAFGLWEGSDLDLEAAYHQAQRETRKIGLAERLQRHVEFRPIVARAHYIETGTLRYFDVHVLDARVPAIEEAFRDSNRHGDGTVVFVVGLENEAQVDFVRAMEDLTRGSDLWLVALPDKVVGLDDALRELEVWRWVRDNIPGLKGDEAAREEVRARISHARDTVEAKAGQVFGLAGHSFRPDLSRWIQGGKIQSRQSSRVFQNWISKLCNRVFSKAPQLNNELLNRQSLSSASSAARRNLIESMMRHQDREGLGIEGTPAEASMYASVLEKGGFHQEHADRWRFAEPEANWQPVWKFLEERFAESTHQRRSVSTLFDELRQPPFGLRDGPLPVVFMAFVLARWDECAFYEDGVYVPEVSIEVIERLLARPDTFEIQSYVLSERERSILLTLAGQIEAVEPRSTSKSELLPIVRSLVRQAASLSAFTRQTKNIEPPEALRVRDELLEATSPRELLFDDLPAILGVDLGLAGGVEKFAAKLRECMLAIRRAYPALLDQIETALRSAFDLPGGPAIEAVVALRRRAEPLVEYALEDTLQVFVREAARLGTERDWREALAAVVIGGIAPAHWSDKDLTVFQVRLKRIAGSFHRLEELATEEGLGDESQVVYRLGVLTTRFDERRAVISVDDEIQAEVGKLVSLLLEHLSKASSGNGTHDRIRLAALAQTTNAILANARGEE